jgi:hypothetical protein
MKKKSLLKTEDKRSSQYPRAYIFYIYSIKFQHSKGILHTKAVQCVCMGGVVLVFQNFVQITGICILPQHSSHFTES